MNNLSAALFMLVMGPFAIPIAIYTLWDQLGLEDLKRKLDRELLLMNS